MVFDNSNFLWILMSLLIKGISSQQSAVCAGIIASLDCSVEPASPVCATGGTTFNTRCHFAKAHCQNTGIHLVHEGPCLPAEAPSSPTDPTDPICPQLTTFVCPQGDVVVCASDNTTYRSLCHYQQARCLNPGLQLISLGSCFPDDTTPTITTTPTSTATTVSTTPTTMSTTTTKPTTTITTATTSTTSPTTTLSTFDVICEAIKDQSCPATNSPVCGSDSVTYTNACELEKAVCAKPGLHLVAEHSC